MQFLHYLLYAAIGLSAGIVGAMLGVGGGVLLVPVFILILGLRSHDATATSMAVIIFTAISATITQYVTKASQIHWEIVIPVAICSILGAVIGIWVKDHVPAPTLRKFFSVFMVVVAIYMWIK